MSAAGMRSEEWDVAVVGGGLVGSALAWGLCQQGLRVGVLDEGDNAIRPSRGNFALVWVQGKGMGMPGYAAWTVRSSEAWAGFAAQLTEQTGIALHHERPGGFHLALSDEELAARARFVADMRNQPGMVEYPCEILDHAQVRALLPAIGPEVAGGSYCPLDGHVNVLQLFRALHTGLKIAGVSYLPGQRVERIAPLSGGFALRSPGLEVHAAKLVLAAGIGNARLAPMVGLNAPVRPQRGQVLVTEKAAPFLSHPVATIRQTDEGGVMIGDSKEEASVATVSPAVLAGMAARAVRMFPLVGRLNVVRSWAALRVMTPDGFPIYEQSREHPGAFVTCCHSGVTLAAAHAQVLAPLIAAGELPADSFARFGSGRFDVCKAA